MNNKQAKITFSKRPNAKVFARAIGSRKWIRIPNPEFGSKIAEYRIIG